MGEKFIKIKLEIKDNFKKYCPEIFWLSKVLLYLNYTYALIKLFCWLKLDISKTKQDKKNILKHYQNKTGLGHVQNAYFNFVLIKIGLKLHVNCLYLNVVEIILCRIILIEIKSV